MSGMKRNEIIILVASVIFSLALLLPTISAMTGAQLELPKWWPAKKVRLGLDLRGGTYLVLGVQTQEAVKSQLNAMSQAIKSDLQKERIGVVRTRVTSDRSVQVVMLGEKGSDQLDAYIRKNFPQLSRAETSNDGGQFLVTYRLPEQQAKDIEKNSVDQAIETIRNRVDQFGVAEPTIQRSGDKRIVVQLPDVTDIESVKKTIGSVAKLEFRVVADESRGSGDVRQIKFRDGTTLAVEDEVKMTGDAIETAGVEISPRDNQIEVTLKFNPLGAQIFDRVTAETVGKRLAIILDGIGQSAPMIRERISGGSAQISGGFTTEDAHRLAIVLRSGALPAPLNFDEQRTVGATLGADSIHKGLQAAAIGCAIVVAFIMFYYKKAGVLAVGCLLLNLIWLMACLVMFGATLTLPGIGGLALTVALAVDSNIIIYERIREELRNGATSRAAVEAGFDRAHWTILDANITTLISGIILYNFGSGPIRGFAVTLSVGIITTVAAALFASRLGFSVFQLKDKKGNLSI